MEILKPVLVLAILGSALLCAPAIATEPPPRAGATAGDVKPATGADQQAPKRKPPKRRAVHQIIDGMPASAPPPQSYRPSLHPAPASMAPPGPAIGHGCSGPACLDNAGGSYKGGVGTTLISPQGRLCSNNGMTVQCF